LAKTAAQNRVKTLRNNREQLNAVHIVDMLKEGAEKVASNVLLL